MSEPIDQKLADNLRRWQASGQPALWAAAHPGPWDPADWQALLATLRWSEYWPMDPAAVRRVLDGPREGPNLQRWQASGAADRWVAAREGEWDHADWLTLLEELRQSEFWPIDPAALGDVLEGLGRACRNLRRWQASGQPRHWVAARRGGWGHDDWVALADALRQSAFWPMDLAAAGRALDELKACYHNLERWLATGEPRRWVAARQGQWSHDEWAGLLDELRQSAFWPLDPAAVGDALAGMKLEWWNLQRWRSSGLAHRWVEARAGRWSHDDWLGLLDELRAGGFWPVDLAAVGAVLEEVRAEWANLGRWQASGGPARWVEARHGAWGQDELHALLESLRASDFWPLEPRAVGKVLDDLAKERRNLRRWQESGHPQRWVAARRDGWGHADWVGLLDELRATEFWPLPVDAVGAALEGLRRADAFRALPFDDGRRWAAGGADRRAA